MSRVRCGLYPNTTHIHPYEHGVISDVLQLPQLKSKVEVNADYGIVGSRVAGVVWVRERQREKSLVNIVEWRRGGLSKQ